MTSSERSSEEQPIVAPPHRVSIGRGGRGNMIAPEEIKYELKKASSTDEYDALAEHTHRRSSSAWSLHSSSSDGTSKTEALKDFFRRGSQSKRKSTSQDGIAEGEEGVEEEEEKA